jgi:hypothetical protein
MIKQETPSNIDPDVRHILCRHDPAGRQLPNEWALLEMRIVAQAMRQSQQQRIDIPSLFPAPQILRWQIPWPVIAAGTMICGLVLGLAIAMMTETRTQNYTVATVLAEPWHGFEE